MNKDAKPSKALVKTAVTSSYLFDWRTINDKIIEPEYFMGVDTYDKEMNAYCLTRRVDGVTEILLSKVIKDENDFEKEVENLAKYFNAKVLRNPVG
jgi:hypothetical protein